MAEYARARRNMAEYGRVWEGQAEYGRAVYQCMYVKAMVELWVSVTDYGKAANQDH